MKFDLLKLSEDFKDTKLSDYKVSKSTKLADRLVSAAKQDIVLIMHFSNNGKNTLDIDDFPFSDDLQNKSDRAKIELNNIINSFIGSSIYKDDNTGYLVISKSDQGAFYTYFVYTKTIKEGSENKEVPTVPKAPGALIYLMSVIKTYSEGSNYKTDFELKLFKDKYLAKGSNDKEFKAYNFFSNIKDQLFDAPVEIKKAFNQVVEYFDSY